MKVKFFWFLKENHALGKFIEACIMQNELSASRMVCEVNDPVNWLAGTITWYHTPQGQKFWDELSYRWEVIAAELMRANN